MSKATTRHHGGVSLCRNNSKASHPPALSPPLLCLKSVQYCQWPDMISPHQGSLLPCMKGLVELTEMQLFQLQHYFQIYRYKMNGTVGCKCGDGNQGWGRTAMWEEVVLKLPLHHAGKNTTVGRALPNKMKKLTINLFISSPCCSIYKKCARCKGVPLRPLHFCLLLTGISAKHFIAVIDMGHTNT